MKKEHFLMVLALMFGLLQLSAQKWDWTTAKLGTFSVGYQKLEAKDYGRPFSLAPMAARALPLHVWYPTLQHSPSKMQFLDYVENEKNPTWDTFSPTSYVQSLAKPYLDSLKLKGIVNKLALLPTEASLNARPPQSKFPVVLLGNGLNSPGFMYSLMAEYLASHGYVVIGFPSLPEHSGAKFEFNDRGVLNQMADLELALHEIAQLPYIDLEHLALIAWSVGGASQILLQMKHQLAKAMVSLDAASQYQYGKDLITHSAYYDSLALQVPFLNLSAAGPTRFVVPLSTFVSDTLAVRKEQHSFPLLSHSHFLSFQQYLIWLDEPNVELKKSYEQMLEMVRVFLDRHLKTKK